ncbi:MAG: 3-hydroxyacyl-CoA dehydrogenase family protein [Myxococcota bacterium]
MAEGLNEQRFVVIGAGVMGHGIAQVAAMAGYDTILTDMNNDALDRGLAHVRTNLDKGVDRGKVTPEMRDAALARLSGSTDLEDMVCDASIVIEAVPEVLELKTNLFAMLDRLAPADALLGSNTSSLPITAIAAATAHPERVIGMHFFNPVHIVKLLEIVTALQTSEETLNRARAIGEALGREMITVRDSPGFATSRLGLVLGLEAIRMLESGVASAEDIDRAMELGYRHPMGPLKLTDLVGLDTRLKIAEALHSELGGEQFRPPPLLRQMVRAGKLGKKSGQGFYSW